MIATQPDGASVDPATIANEAIMSPGADGEESKPRMHLGFHDLLPTNIVELTERNMVQLERVFLRPPCIFCSIRVNNTAYQKSVVLRITMDGWKTYHDVEAAFLHGAGTGSTDRFEAALEVPHDRLINAVEFAVAFRVHGREFWDSNNGRNYRVDVTYVTPPKPKVNKFVFKLSGDQVTVGIPPSV